jgi:mRNA-degrading endonuclease toxin of MazEF toxin-antitoxin module
VRCHLAGRDEPQFKERYRRTSFVVKRKISDEDRRKFLERAVVLDQIRSVDKLRLVKKVGEIETFAQRAVMDRLQEFFAE